MPIPSLHLEERERVLLVLHRHWFVLVRELSAVFFMIFAGIMVFSIKSVWYRIVDPVVFDHIISFLLSLYALLILTLLFAIWINYRLDVWIVTTKRIIDIEQRGLFNREVSEFLITNVQDITIRTPNFISTVLKFGNMTIQTSGAQNFLVRDIPNAESAKDIILRYCHSTKPLNQDLGIMNKEATLKNS